MNSKQREHFDSLNEQFTLICESAKLEGCECPTVGSGDKSRVLVGQQIVKGIGAVPCERRCAWDLERIDRIKGR